MGLIEISKFYNDLKRYKKGVLNFSQEEFKQIDSTYMMLEFSGEPEKIYQESFEAIKKGLTIHDDTIYFILFANNDDRIDKVMKAIPIDEIRSLTLKEKYGLYLLPKSEGNLPLKLILIFR